MCQRNTQNSDVKKYEKTFKLWFQKFNICKTIINFTGANKTMYHSIQVKRIYAKLGLANEFIITLNLIK